MRRRLGVIILPHHEELDADAAGVAAAPKHTLAELNASAHSTEHPFLRSRMDGKNYAYRVINTEAGETHKSGRRSHATRCVDMCAGHGSTRSPSLIATHNLLQTLRRPPTKTLSNTSIEDHVRGQKPSSWISLSLDIWFSLQLASRAIIRDDFSCTTATIVEIDLRLIDGPIMNLAVDRAAQANGLTGELLYQAWSSSEVLVAEIPVAALTGRYFELDKTTTAGERLLGVAGLDRLVAPCGKVTNFGSHRMWRDEFDCEYNTTAKENQLLRALQQCERRSMLDSAGGEGGPGGRRTQKRKGRV